MNDSEGKRKPVGRHKTSPLSREQQLAVSRKKSNYEKKQIGLVERKYWLKAANANTLATTKLKLNGYVINGIEVKEIGSLLDILIENFLPELVNKYS